MNRGTLWKRFLSTVLLLSILAGLLPVQGLAAEERETPAAETDFTALYEALTAPANQLIDLSAISSTGMSTFDEGTYYIVNHSISSEEGLLLDMNVRYDDVDHYHATPVTVRNGSVIDGDPHKAIRLRPGIVGGEYRKDRVQLWPIIGTFGGGESLKDIADYAGLYVGSPSSAGVALRNNDLIVHYYLHTPTDQVGWYGYSITYVDTIQGFRPVFNKDYIGTEYNQFKLYRLAFHVSELYKAIMRMKDYADGNPAGRYDAAVYEDFAKDLRDCINTYNAENKLYETDAEQESKKTALDAKAETLLSYLGKLTSVDSSVDYIDIPAEFLDFRADGLFFEYGNGNKEYNLQQHGKKVFAPLGVGGNVFTEMTEPVLLDRKLIYNQGTVTYIANQIHQGKRGLISDYHADGWNSNFYNRLETPPELGSWEETLTKTTGKKLPNGNGGTLLYKDVVTAFDLAYYILNYTWQKSDPTDVLNTTEGLSYNTVVQERDRIRLYTDPEKKGYYTLDAACNTVYDGYYIYNAIPVKNSNTPWNGCNFQPLNGLGFEHPDVLKTLNKKDTDQSDWYAKDWNYQQKGNNFHYTMHAYGSFVYYKNQDLYFEFIGDDDVYFFINGEMALDLGGTHYAVGDGIYLNDFRFADGSRLQEGQVYDFDMFYAERHSTESNMRFSTNIKIVDTATLTTKSQYLEHSDTESFVDSSSGMGKELRDNATVKVGDIVAYSFNILNRREVPVVELSFRDNSLGTVLSKDSFTLYNEAKTNGAKTLITDLRLFYRSYDPEKDLTHSGEPVMLSYDELLAKLEAPLKKPDGTLVKEYASLPNGSYGIQIQTEDQLKTLLTMGIPRNCSLSIYGFKRKTVVGDSPYKNTMSSQCYYSRLVTNEGVEEEKFLIAGSASRVLQVVATAPEAIPQEYVLDYGKALPIPLEYLNAAVITDSLVQVKGFCGVTTKGSNSAYLTTLPSSLYCRTDGEKLSTAIGTLERKGDILSYQPTGFMEAIDTLYAVFELEGYVTIDAQGTATEYKYIMVEMRFLPATVMYYETDLPGKTLFLDDSGRTLLFHFDNSEEARNRYRGAVYGGYNFDREGKGYWATNATAVGETTNLNNYSISNSQGLLSVTVGDEKEGEEDYGPKIMTTNTYNKFPWNTYGQYAPLSYDPSKAEVLQVRFRLQGVEVAEEGVPTSVEMEFHYDDADGIDHIKYDDARTDYEFKQGEFITLEIKLSDTFKKAKQITSLGLRFLGIKSPNAQQLGKVEIDYIFVGREEQLTTMEKESRNLWQQVEEGDSDLYQDLDMDQSTVDNGGNEILRQLKADTVVQPTYLGAQDALSKQQNKLPISFSHMGAFKNAPKDSLLSVYDAIRLGLDGTEIDIQLSKDGVLVLCHDAHIANHTTVADSAADDVKLLERLDWAKLKTTEIVGPFAGSADTAFKISAEQASVLNSLPNYVNHYGASATAGKSLPISRLDDTLDLVAMYGPKTLLTLDKMTGPEIFAACYKLVHEKAMLDQVIFKIAKDAATLKTWFAAAATAANTTSEQVASTVQIMYVDGATSATNLSAIENHVAAGDYLHSVEITYGADKAAAAEAGILSTLKPYCQANGIALYGSTIGTSYCGGRGDEEKAWAELLELGFDGIMADSTAELAAYLHSRNSQRSSADTIQAEHFHSFNTEVAGFRIQEERDQNRNKLVRGLKKGDWLKYDNITFTGSETKLYFRGQGLQQGATLRFYIDEIASAKCIGAYTLGQSRSPYTMTLSLRIPVPAGVHSLIVLADGVNSSELLHFDSFSFQADSHYLFFDYTGTTEDLDRYSTAVYGRNNYDVDSAWEGGTNVKSISVENGNLKFTFDNSITYSYIQTGGTLDLKPTDADRCVIRMSIQNAETRFASGITELYFYYCVNGAWANNAYRIDTTLDLATLSDQGYFTVEFPMNEPGYVTADYISDLRVYFSNIQGKNDGDVTVSIDYIYIGPVQPTNELYFGFGGSEQDLLRYEDPVYGGFNYDQVNKGYWATNASANDTTDPDYDNRYKNFTIDQSKGLALVQVGDTKEGETGYGPKFMTTNTHGVYTWTGRGSYAPLRFDPASAEVVEVRFKLNNCVTDNNLKLQVDMHYQDEAGTYYNKYVVNQVVYAFDNSNYQTITVPLENLGASYPLVTSLGLRFCGIYKADPNDTTATVAIDYIYMGPKDGAPSAQPLYFDFSNTLSDRERYDSPLYGYYSFDKEGDGYWATHATQNDNTDDKSNNLTNYAIDNSVGVATVLVGDGKEGESDYGPKFMTTNSYGHFPWKNDHQYAPLHFNPSEAEVLQVRFRLDNVAQAGNMNLEMEFRRTNADGSNTIKYDMQPTAYSLLLGEYQVVTMELPAEFTTAAEINSLGLRFTGIKSPNASALGTVTIDYIYVGTREGIPSRNTPTYGWDSSYIDDPFLSNGSSLHVEGRGVLIDSSEEYTRASFSFQGTGFDLISRTGMQEATIRVAIYSDAAMTQTVKTLTVNNKGELELYQIPVVSVQGLAHGRYYVTIDVNKATKSPNPAFSFLSRGGSFYLDAIRIYEPLDPEAPAEKEARDAYRQDAEASPYIKEVRNILLSKESFDNLNGTIEGAVFLDVNSSIVDPESGTITGGSSIYYTDLVQTYKTLGPKNEVYLSPNQAIAFRLQVDSQKPIASLDIGAKSISGSEPRLEAGFVVVGSNNALTVKNKELFPIRSSTAQYYAIETENILTNNLNGQQLVYLLIRNTAPMGYANPEENVLSITDIKVAYTDEPGIGLPEDKPTDPEVKKSAKTAAPVRFLVDSRTPEALVVFMQTEKEAPQAQEVEIPILHSLNLESDISINYVVSSRLLADYDSCYLELRMPVYEGSLQTDSETLRLQPVAKGNYTYFSLTGLTAVRMNDVMEAKLCLTANGQDYVSPTDSYCIAAYAHSQLSKAAADRRLKTLCADLLRYGAAAQSFKGYRTEALADQAMTQEQKAYLSDLNTVSFADHNSVLADVADPVIFWAGKTLSLESRVVLRFILDASAYEGDVQALTLRLSYTDSEGTPVTKVLTAPESFNSEKGWYAFDFSELKAAELRTVVSAAIYEGDTQLSPTLQYSVDTYCKGKTGALGHLCKAMLAYSDSAKALFA